MIKKLRYLCTLLLIAVASAAWADEVYKTLDFATASGESSNYTSTWTAIAADNTEYSMENFNSFTWQSISGNIRFSYKGYKVQSSSSLNKMKVERES